jgi:Tol biopolymer transport system component
MGTAMVRSGAISLTAIVALLAVSEAEGAPISHQLKTDKITNGKIVFERNSTIHVMGKNGKHVRPMQRFGYDPQWSPDGKKIAFTRWPPSRSKPALYVMRANGKGRHRVTPSRGLGDADPSWSPGGKAITFVRSSDQGFSLLRVAVDARGRAKTKPVTIYSSEQGLYDPSWSPDGKRIAFAMDYANSVDIFTIRARGKGAPRRLTSDARRTDLQPDWSPDGSRIVFMGAFRPGVSGIFSMKANGSGQTNLLHEAGVYGSEPAWSPNGKRIVFVGSNASTYLGIFTMRANGQGTLNGLNVNSGDRSPDWQPVRG